MELWEAPRVEEANRDSYSSVARRPVDHLARCTLIATIIVQNGMISANRKNTMNQIIQNSWLSSVLHASTNSWGDRIYAKSLIMRNIRDRVAAIRTALILELYSKDSFSISCKSLLAVYCTIRIPKQFTLIFSDASTVTIACNSSSEVIKTSNIAR